MPGTCCVCQDDMDMEEFNDTRATTDTCFKLECGHAYHTRCIFQYMRETDYECLHCNVHRTPREEIEMTGLIAQTIEDLRSDPELRRLRQEAEEAIREFKAVQTEVKHALQALAPDIVARSGYSTIRRETLRRIQTLRTQVREECLRRTPMTAGVWGIAGDQMLSRAFVPRGCAGLHGSYIHLKI